MCVTLFSEVTSAPVRRGSWRQRANLTVLISLVRFINKLQRHEVELEKCVTSIHSAPFVRVWDCFSRLAGQREPIHSTFSPAVWWLRWMGLWSMSRARGGGAAGRALRAAELKREEKDLLSSYKVATLLWSRVSSPVLWLPYPLLPLSEGPDLPCLLFKRGSFHAGCKPRERLASIRADNQGHYLSSTLLMSWGPRPRAFDLAQRQRGKRRGGPPSASKSRRG